MQLNPLVARGRVIAAARMLAGLDQEQLATEAGLAPSTVALIGFRGGDGSVTQPGRR